MASKDRPLKFALGNVAPSQGRLSKISKSFKTRKQAESYKKITLAEILQGTFNQNKNGELTLADLIDLYLKELGHNFRRSKLGAYRPALGLDIALKEINTQRGIYLDPAVVDSCMRLAKSGQFDV
jgi:hypothetical protein